MSSRPSKYFQRARRGARTSQRPDAGNSATNARLGSNLKHVSSVSRGASASGASGSPSGALRPAHLNGRIRDLAGASPAAAGPAVSFVREQRVDIVSHRSPSLPGTGSAAPRLPATVSLPAARSKSSSRTRLSAASSSGPAGSDGMHESSGTPSALSQGACAPSGGGILRSPGLPKRDLRVRFAESVTITSVDSRTPTRDRNRGAGGVSSSRSRTGTARIAPPAEDGGRGKPGSSSSSSSKGGIPRTRIGAGGGASRASSAQRRADAAADLASQQDVEALFAEARPPVLATPRPRLAVLGGNGPRLGSGHGSSGASRSAGAGSASSSRAGGGYSGPAAGEHHPSKKLSPGDPSMGGQSQSRSRSRGSKRTQGRGGRLLSAARQAANAWTGAGADAQPHSVTAAEAQDDASPRAQARGTTSASARMQRELGSSSPSAWDPQDSPDHGTRGGRGRPAPTASAAGAGRRARGGARGTKLFAAAGGQLSRDLALTDGQPQGQGLQISSASSGQAAQRTGTGGPRSGGLVAGLDDLSSPSSAISQESASSLEGSADMASPKRASPVLTEDASQRRQRSPRKRSPGLASIVSAGSSSSAASSPASLAGWGDSAAEPGASTGSTRDAPSPRRAQDKGSSSSSKARRRRQLSPQDLSPTSSDADAPSSADAATARRQARRHRALARARLEQGQVQGQGGPASGQSQTPPPASSLPLTARQRSRAVPQSQSPSQRAAPPSSSDGSGPSSRTQLGLGSPQRPRNLLAALDREAAAPRRQLGESRKRHESAATNEALEAMQQRLSTSSAAAALACWTGHAHALSAGILGAVPARAHMQPCKVVRLRCTETGHPAEHFAAVEASMECARALDFCPSRSALADYRYAADSSGPIDGTAEVAPPTPAQAAASAAWIDISSEDGSETGQQAAEIRIETAHGTHRSHDTSLAGAEWPDGAVSCLLLSPLLPAVPGSGTGAASASVHANLVPVGLHQLTAAQPSQNPGLVQPDEADSVALAEQQNARASSAGEQHGPTSGATDVPASPLQSRGAVPSCSAGMLASPLVRAARRSMSRSPRSTSLAPFSSDAAWPVGSARPSATIAAHRFTVRDRPSRAARMRAQAALLEMAAGSESGSSSDSESASGSEDDDDTDDDDDEEDEEYDEYDAELSADVVAQLHWTAADAGGTTTGPGHLLGSETAADAAAGGPAAVTAQGSPMQQADASQLSQGKQSLEDRSEWGGDAQAVATAASVQQEAHSPGAAAVPSAQSPLLAARRGSAASPHGSPSLARLQKPGPAGSADRPVPVPSGATDAKPPPSPSSGSDEERRGIGGVSSAAGDAGEARTDGRDDGSEHGGGVSRGRRGKKRPRLVMAVGHSPVDDTGDESSEDEEEEQDDKQDNGREEASSLPEERPMKRRRRAAADEQRNDRIRDTNRSVGGHGGGDPDSSSGTDSDDGGNSGLSRSSNAGEIERAARSVQDRPGKDKGQEPRTGKRRPGQHQERGSAPTRVSSSPRHKSAGRNEGTGAANGGSGQAAAATTKDHEEDLANAKGKRKGRGAGRGAAVHVPRRPRRQAASPKAREAFANRNSFLGTFPPKASEQAVVL